MNEPNEAIELIINSLKAVTAEKISLFEAGGRVMAEKAISRRTLPPMNTSTLDGYAVKKSDMDAGLRKFKVKGVLAAGSDISKLDTLSGECWRVMTGGFLPEGTDFIVKHELTDNSMTEVTVFELPSRDGVRVKGEEANVGDVLDYSGVCLEMQHMAYLSSRGAHYVKVYRKPRIAVFSTGNEVVSADVQDSPLKIFDSNSVAIKAILEKEGCDVNNLGVIEDEPEHLAETLESLRGYDLIISTGGSSAGDFDYFARIPEKLGIEWTVFHINQRPAQPVCYGTSYGTPFFALPGTPVGAVMCALQYVLPAVRVLAGRKNVHNIYVDAVLQEALDKRVDCTQNNLADCKYEDGMFKAYPKPLANYSLKMLAAANAILSVDNGKKGVVEAGSIVKAFIFGGLK